ncbi:ParA family protein [Dechloromonas hortensis]|uniref:ParA family protein n=1 Tax=Dechloromonas hortensis TaxID=337779 RepID=UPI0012927EB2|nr:ParA family protein [Dechloromonas hortensis]
MTAKTIAFSNHKGGVAKTSLSVNIADALARDGYSVLFVDLDPQGNGTQLVYGYDETPAITVEQVLAGKESIAAAIVDKTQIPGVSLIGATLKLARLERDLQLTPFASTSILLTKLQSVRDVFDVIILDTPPALSFLTANALAAADCVFVPVESGSKLALVGTDDMLEFVSQAKTVNPRLKLGGAVLTKHDGRKKLCKITQAVIGDYFDTVLGHVLPQSADIGKSQAVGQTVLQYDRECTASREVVEIAREIATIAGLTKEAAE